jgi:hypothetical protein
MNRLPLWSTLLGTAALSGAYEFTFAAAPPELASTSVSTATTLLFNVAVGFLAAALVAPTSRPEPTTGHRSAAPSDDSTKTSRPTKKTSADSADSKLDDFMMEKTK